MLVVFNVFKNPFFSFEIETSLSSYIYYHPTHWIIAIEMKQEIDGALTRMEWLLNTRPSEEIQHSIDVKRRFIGCGKPPTNALNIRFNSRSRWVYK